MPRPKELYVVFEGKFGHPNNERNKSEYFAVSFERILLTGLDFLYQGI
jgi:hypothetical protein